MLGLSALLAIGATFQANVELQREADRDSDESARSAVISAQLLLLTVPYVASILSAVLDVLVLTWALIALANDSDPVPLTLPTALLVVSFVLLWVQVYFVATISFGFRSERFVEIAQRRQRRLHDST